MKKLQLASAITALVLSTSANAALIDMGTYTTDDVSGLNWLDLSITDSQSYNSAISLNPGWRHATQAEMTNLFSTAFDGVYDTSGNGSGYSVSSIGYDDQVTDMAQFNDLFGLTSSGATSYGWYMNEAGALTLGGVSGSYVYFDYTYDYTSTYLESGHSSVGVFMVQTSVVPVPAAVWLFGSGLIGLAGFARRKKA